MAGALGMRRGLFAQADRAEFVVLSWWRSLLDHEAYRRERLPGFGGGGHHAGLADAHPGRDRDRATLVGLSVHRPARCELK